MNQSGCLCYNQLIWGDLLDKYITAIRCRVGIDNKLEGAICFAKEL